ALGNGAFEITAPRMFTEPAAAQNLTVTLVHAQQTLQVTSSLRVVTTEDLRLTPAPGTLTVVERQSLAGTLATIVASNPNARPQDFRVQIQWGDSSNPEEFVPTSFQITRPHTYWQAGPRLVQVTVTSGSDSATATTGVLVLGAPLSVSGSGSLGTL